MIRPVVAVLNPRNIPECMDSFRALPVDKVWVRRYTEPQLADLWPHLLEEAARRGYTHLSAISDDTIAPPRAWQAILENIDAAPCVTGWCNLQTHGDSRANITDSPLVDRVPSIASYDFPTAWDVLTGPALRPTWFSGMSFTTMRVETWQRFLFRPYMPSGCASDYNLSLQLQDAGLGIVCARDAFIQHVKATFNAHDATKGRELLNGREPSEVRWEDQP